MEEMVPELEDLQARGYCSRGEIRRIVQRRQDFEYALKRMAAVKEDYLRCEEGGGTGRLLQGAAATTDTSLVVLPLGAEVGAGRAVSHSSPAITSTSLAIAARRYVDYECKLEELRQLRRRERSITGRKTLADYAIPRRVHFIYERALRKFKCVRACVRVRHAALRGAGCGAQREGRAASWGVS